MDDSKHFVTLSAAKVLSSALQEDQPQHPTVISAINVPGKEDKKTDIVSHRTTNLRCLNSAGSN